MFLRLSALLLSIFILSCKTNEISTSAYSRQELKKGRLITFGMLLTPIFKLWIDIPQKHFLV